MEEFNFNFRYVLLRDLDIPRKKMAEAFANSGDPDQTPSDLGFHCLPINVAAVSRLQWVKLTFYQMLMCLKLLDQLQSPRLAASDLGLLFVQSCPS